MVNELDLYVDLVDLAERIAETSTNPAVRERASLLLAELIGPQPLIVAGSHHAQSNRLPGEYRDGVYIDLSGAHGLSIFYPARPDTVVYDRYLKHQIFSFTERSRWTDFLNAALGPVADGPLVPPPPLSPLDPDQGTQPPGARVPATAAALRRAALSPARQRACPAQLQAAQRGPIRWRIGPRIGSKIAPSRHRRRIVL